MDGSKYFQMTRAYDTAQGATRIALSIDKDAVGLTKHAAEIGHLVEWWLQGSDPMGTMAAFRLGRKLERFRLAARLSEGRVSKPVRATLDALKQELAAHRTPQPVIDAVDRAYAEAARLEAALAAATTTIGSASPMELPTRSQHTVQQRQRSADQNQDDANKVNQDGEGSDDPTTTIRTRTLRWVLLAALVGGGAWLALTETGTQLMQPVIQSLTGLI